MATGAQKLLRGSLIERPGRGASPVFEYISMFYSTAPEPSDACAERKQEITKCQHPPPPPQEKEKAEIEDDFILVIHLMMWREMARWWR